MGNRPEGLIRKVDEEEERRRRRRGRNQTDEAGEWLINFLLLI
jgi:hypothetical protein